MGYRLGFHGIARLSEPGNLWLDRESALFLGNVLARLLGSEFEAKAIASFGHLNRITIFARPILDQTDPLFPSRS